MKKLLGPFAVLGMLAALLLGGTTAPALADGPTNITICSNQGGGQSTVTCLGLVNGNNITIDISNIRVLNDVELNLLKVNLTNVVINALTIGDIQLQVNKIASDTVVVLKDVLNIQVCQVKVIEIGVVNNNIAKCEN
ncbi:MAG: hypothetical protein ICV68_16070 [Pyrinomonadaceae bacterium]|nr:hypothetical protein [Pyrinomonadaceae bacterium]